jgi:hypothetical protein
MRDDHPELLALLDALTARQSDPDPPKCTRWCDPQTGVHAHD